MELETHPDILKTALQAEQPEAAHRAWDHVLECPGCYATAEHLENYITVRLREMGILGAPGASANPAGPLTASPPTTGAVRAKQIVDQVNDLLMNVKLDTQSPLILQAASVWVAIHSQRADEEGPADLHVAVRPLRSGVDVAGTTVILRRTEERGVIHYGLLDRNGHIVFRNVESGDYHMHVRQRVGLVEEDQLPLPGSMPRLPQNLVQLPPQSLAMTIRAATREAAVVRRIWQIFRNADGSILATIQEREAGQLGLNFKVADRDWDGTLLAFVWMPARRAGEEQPQAKALYAPLAWSDLFSACMAEIDLGRAPQEFQIALPEKPIQPDQIPETAAGRLEESVRGAATPHTYEAWRRTLRLNNNLPPAVRAALEEILGR